MCLLSLGHRRNCIFQHSLWMTHAEGNKPPHSEDPDVERSLRSQQTANTNFPVLWRSPLEVDSLAPVKSSDNLHPQLISDYSFMRHLTSRETCPAEIFQKSWHSESMNTINVIVFVLFCLFINVIVSSFGVVRYAAIITGTLVIFSQHHLPTSLSFPYRYVPFIINEIIVSCGPIVGPILFYWVIPIQALIPDILSH